MTTAEKLILAEIQALKAQVARLTATMLPEPEAPEVGRQAVINTAGMSTEEKLEYFTRLSKRGRRR